MSVTDFPCGECDARAGEPCADDCPLQLEFAAVEFSDPAWPEDEVIDTPPMDESLSKLAAAVHVLPFGGRVGVRGTGAPDRQDHSAEEYIARLADWMVEYQQVLRAEVDELSRQSRERIGLQLEKDIVTNYLRGVPV